MDERHVLDLVQGGNASALLLAAVKCARPPRRHPEQVVCLALLVFRLIKHQVTRALGPQQTMTCLYPDNRWVRPAGRTVPYPSTN